MNLFFALPLVVLASPMVALAEEEDAATIAPSLGAKFGVIMEIEGRVVDDRDTRQRSDLGKTLIEVHYVGEKKLPTPVVIGLATFTFADVKIPERGAWVRFRGYESGGFTGIPKAAFADLPSVATAGHRFVCEFQLTKALDPKHAPSKPKQ
ncbi:hypothetical protein [Luteolibacter sp. Populi]|uniref:hypothetical protein n=1 Tax=Luteolibacter sp. Populi TaxID=3230487 RepID=UPI0034667AB5